MPACRSRSASCLILCACVLHCIGPAECSRQQHTVGVWAVQYVSSHVNATLKLKGVVFLFSQWAAATLELVSLLHRPTKPSSAFAGQTETSGIVQHDETPVLVSGAGHDALAMADLTEVCSVLSVICLSL